MLVYIYIYVSICLYVCVCVSDWSANSVEFKDFFLLYKFIFAYVFPNETSFYNLK